MFAYVLSIEQLLLPVDLYPNFSLVEVVLGILRGGVHGGIHIIFGLVAVHAENLLQDLEGHLAESFVGKSEQVTRVLDNLDEFLRFKEGTVVGDEFKVIAVEYGHQSIQLVNILLLVEVFKHGQQTRPHDLVVAVGDDIGRHVDLGDPHPGHEAGNRPRAHQIDADYLVN